jgi:two-component system, response regulator PdtaR
VLNILIVEDEPLFARTLKHLVELNPRYVVTGIAEDFAGALAAVQRRRPDLALVDLQLAHGSTGFSVAAKLVELGIACLFTSGKAPSFPIPDLALGCLIKPFSEEDLVRALKTAEDLLRGRERLRPSRPGNLRLYGEESDALAAATTPAPPAAQPDPRRRGTLLSRWWSQGRRYG